MSVFSRILISKWVVNQIFLILNIHITRLKIKIPIQPDAQTRLLKYSKHCSPPTHHVTTPVRPYFVLVDYNIIIIMIMEHRENYNNNNNIITYINC